MKGKVKNSRLRTKTPRLSVVMATFNAQEFLREAIESILNQTFKDFEFIIIDDGSTDETVKIVKSYPDPRLKLYQRPHQGLVAALNYGLQVSKGDYIARMDADDVSHPARFALEVDFLDTHPDYAVVGTTVEVIDEKGRFVKISAVPLHYEDLRFGLLVRDFLIHGAVMMRKDAVRKLGGYDPEAWYAEDYDLWARMARSHKIANLAPALFKWRKNPQGVSATKAKRQQQTATQIRAREWELSTKGGDFAKFHLSRFFKMPASLHRADPFSKLRRETLSDIYLAIGQKLLAENRRFLSLKFILASLFLLPAKKKSYFYLFLSFLPQAVGNSVKRWLEIATQKDLS